MARTDQKSEVFRIISGILIFLVILIPQFSSASLRISSVYGLVESASGKDRPCLKWDMKSLRGEEIQNRDRRTYAVVRMRAFESAPGCLSQVKMPARMKRTGAKNEYLFLVEAPFDNLAIQNGAVKERLSFEVRLEDTMEARVRRVSNEMVVSGEFRGAQLQLSDGNSVFIPTLGVQARFPSLIFNSAQVKVSLGTSPFKAKDGAPFVSEVSAGLLMFPWYRGSKNVNSLSILLGFYGQDFHIEPDSPLAPDILSRRSVEFGSEFRFALSERARLGMSVTTLGHFLKTAEASQYDWSVGLGIALFGFGGRMTELFGTYGQSTSDLASETNTKTDKTINVGLRVLFQPALFGR
jgi:hypothetical protein